MKVAVIGTSGRGSKYKLDRKTWLRMRHHFFKLLDSLGDVELVSGGAPWADHLAVAAYLEGKAEKLTLYVPAILNSDGTYEPDPSVEHNPGKRLNELFEKFEEAIWTSARQMLIDAVAMGAEVVVAPGFFQRNDRVAKDADYLVAYSFGDNCKTAGDLKSDFIRIPSGGTAYTWDKSRARIKQSVSVVTLEDAPDMPTLEIAAERPTEPVELFSPPEPMVFTPVPEPEVVIFDEEPEPEIIVEVELEDDDKPAPRKKRK